jgi:hypothetical protein
MSGEERKGRKRNVNGNQDGGIPTHVHDALKEKRFDNMRVSV